MVKVYNFIYTKTHRTFNISYLKQPEAVLLHCKYKATADYIIHWLNTIEQRFHLLKQEKFYYTHVVKFLKDEMPNIENMSIKQLQSEKDDFLYYTCAALIYESIELFYSTTDLYGYLLHDITYKKNKNEKPQKICLERFLNNPNNKDEREQFGLWLERAYSAIHNAVFLGYEELDKKEFEKRFEFLLCGICCNFPKRRHNKLSPTGCIKQIVNKYRTNIGIDTYGKILQCDESDTPYSIEACKLTSIKTKRKCNP